MSVDTSCRSAHLRMFPIVGPDVRANNREGVEGEWVMGNGEEWRMICFLMCAHTYMLRVGRKLVIHIQTDILHKVLGSKSSKLLLLWTLALQEGHFLLPSGTHGHKEPPPRTYQPLQNLVLNP